jgi:hypothetical protein
MRLRSAQAKTFCLLLELIGMELVRIPRSAKPFQPIRVLHMAGILEDLEQFRVTPDSAAVVRRRRALPRDALWQPLLWLGLEDRLQLDPVRPTVAEIILIGDVALSLMSRSLKLVVVSFSACSSWNLGSE